MTLLAVTLMFAAPGTAGAATIFFDDFNRPNSNDVGNGWIVSEDGRRDVSIRNNRLRMRDKDGSPSVTQTGIDTSGYENIMLSFDYGSFAGSGQTTERADILSVLFDAGNGFEQLEAIRLGDDGTKFSVAFDLPASAGDVEELSTQLALRVSTNKEGVFIDNFVVSGDLIKGREGEVAGSMPEPNAALLFGIGMLTLGAHLRRS